MIVTVHRDRWFRAEFEPGTGIARVARTAEPWDDPKAGEASYRAIATHAWPRPKSELRLLFDLRAAPPRNDAVFEEVVKLRASGVAVLMVEQNARRALEFTDQAFVLELGRVRLEGSGRALLDDPQVRELYLGGGTLTTDTVGRGAPCDGQTERAG